MWLRFVGTAVPGGPLVDVESHGQGEGQGHGGAGALCPTKGRGKGEGRKTGPVVRPALLAYSIS